MYLRYIYKLHDLHYPADNFTEAGFTLKLYADSLSWSSTNSLPNDSRANGVPEWKRKEELYHQIINYFDKGKVSKISSTYIFRCSVHKTRLPGQMN